MSRAKGVAGGITPMSLSGAAGVPARQERVLAVLCKATAGIGQADATHGQMMVLKVGEWERAARPAPGRARRPQRHCNYA